MKWSFLNQPLGLSIPAGCPVRKEWFWVIPAAISAVSAIAGGIASKNANDKARDRLNAEKAETEAERKRNKYQAWTDTLQGQNTIRQLQDMGDREISRITGSAKVGGATEAAVAAEKDALRQQQAEVIANAAARHEDNVDVKDASYRQELRGINQQLIGNDLQQGQNTAQMAAGVSNAFMQAAAGLYGGSMGSTPSQLSQMNGNYQKLQGLLFQGLMKNGIIA